MPFGTGLCHLGTHNTRMTSLAELLQHGAAYGWLFVPTAIALGALHGLEPGHSKSLMAAFIVAVNGTVKQAIILGMAATISHTAVVWAVALLGLYLGQGNDAHASEPYFQLASAMLILIIGTWMLLRIYNERHHRHEHHHGDGHIHSHANDHGHDHETDINTRFAGRTVTNGQIILFGLSGGLIPCPAAITVLLLCLQLKHFTLGMTLVMCFSIGLALTLVASGVVAAIGARSAARRLRWLPSLIHKAPYIAGSITLLLGTYLSVTALQSILK